jgi:thioredoxin 1
LTVNEEFDEELERIRAKRLKTMTDELMNNPGGSSNDMPGEPVVLDENNFDDIIKKYSIVVVDCWAPWCGPCRMVAPTIEELAKDYQGKIVFGKLNTDENQGIAMKFNIMSIPTFLIFKNGDLIDRPVGAMPKASLEEAITKHMD